MKNRYTTVLLLVVLAILTSCQKDKIFNLPDGAILLTTEGYSSHGEEKTSVEDNSVQWVGGESVSLNGESYEVSVADGKAYVTADIGGGAVYGYYACGTVSNGTTTTPTVTLPASYTYGISGTRQVIDLPMAAYASSTGSAIQFKHLTAAVKVMLWNNTAADLHVSKVVVRTENYGINGSRTLDLTADGYGIPTVSGAAASQRRVEVRRAAPLTIPAGDDSKSIQVPIAPIGSDKITIDVYCHNGSNHYLYSYTPDATISLGRNMMLTARVKLDPTGHMASVVDLGSLTADYTAQDGDILTGSLSNSYNVYIADDATVTLHGVNIKRTNDKAGIICNGDATIVLSDSSYVKGHDKPGIQPGGAGTTLTITGNGKLYAYGHSVPAIGVDNTECGNITFLDCNVRAFGYYSTGIGAETNGSCGDITINGGNVVASTFGGIYTGIGSSHGGSCGNIAIIDGNVKAMGNPAIGGGGNQCGNITINGGNVTATIYNYYSTRYGPGIGGTCGNITITGGYVTVKGQEGYEQEATAIGTNDTCGDITISGGTVKAMGGYYGIGIGAARQGKCGTITITNNIVSITATGDNGSIIGKDSDCSSCSCDGVRFGNQTMYNGTEWTTTPVDGNTYGGLSLSISTTNNTNDTWTLMPAK